MREDENGWSTLGSALHPRERPTAAGSTQRDSPEAMILLVARSQTEVDAGAAGTHEGATSPEGPTTLVLGVLIAPLGD